jgi:hypothetical protein
LANVLTQLSSTAGVSLAASWWHEKVGSVLTLASEVVPFTAMLSLWLHDVQNQKLSQRELLDYPNAKYGPRTTDLMKEFYSQVRAQQPLTIAIELTPALDSFRGELTSLEAAGFLAAGYSWSGFVENPRLSNAGFIIDLALLCDDPSKCVRLNEIIQGAKRRLNGAELSGSVGLPLIVVNAFFQQYQQRAMLLRR